MTLSASMNLKAEKHTGVDVFGMGVSLDGTVDLNAQLNFGYDSYGLRETIHQAEAGTPSAYDIASDIADGFYIRGDSQIMIGGSIQVGAGVSVGIAKAEVKGYLGTGKDGATDTPITVGIKRPAAMESFPWARCSPIPPMLLASKASSMPACCFISRWAFAFWESSSATKKTLASPIPSFSLSLSPAATPYVLASQPDPQGLIALYIGDQASHRSGVDNHDGGPDGDGESYAITHVGDDFDSQGNYAGETIEIDAFNRSQIIHKVKSIHGVGDVGDLTIKVDPAVKSLVNLYGGQGHATLNSGAGGGHLEAGQLSSTLRGGSGANTLVGGPGDDSINAIAGTNFIYDDAGKNLITIQAGVTRGVEIVHSSSAAFNVLDIIASKTTTSIDAMPDIQGTLANSSLKIDWKDSEHGEFSDFISYISQLVVDTKQKVVAVDIGDLSTVGINQITLDETSTGATWPRDPFGIAKRRWFIVIGAEWDCVRSVSRPQQSSAIDHVDGRVHCQLVHRRDVRCLWPHWGRHANDRAPRRGGVDWRSWFQWRHNPNRRSGQYHGLRRKLDPDDALSAAWFDDRPERCRLLRFGWISDFRTGQSQCHRPGSDDGGFDYAQRLPAQRGRLEFRAYRRLHFGGKAARQFAGVGGCLRRHHRLGGQQPGQPDH